MSVIVSIGRFIRQCSLSFHLQVVVVVGMVVFVIVLLVVMNGFRSRIFLQIGDDQIHLTSTTTSVEHHGMQLTGCMDIEPEPSHGVPCKGLFRKADEADSTMPRAAQLEGGSFFCHRGCIPCPTSLARGPSGN